MVLVLVHILVHSLSVFPRRLVEFIYFYLGQAKTVKETVFLMNAFSSSTLYATSLLGIATDCVCSALWIVLNALPEWQAHYFRKQQKKMYALETDLMCPSLSGPL